MLRYILRPVLWERVLWDLGGKETGLASWLFHLECSIAAFRSTDGKDSSAVHCLLRTHSCWGPGTFLEVKTWSGERSVWSEQSAGTQTVCHVLPWAMEPKKGASSTLPAESKDFGHSVGWTSPVEPFSWDLKCLLPTCGQELIAEVATPCELLQRQLCSSPRVHVINQQLLPIRGTRARPPLQCPLGTFQVCGRQLTGRRSFCSAWLKGLRAI